MEKYQEKASHFPDELADILPTQILANDIFPSLTIKNLESYQGGSDGIVGARIVTF
jgi:hypothetical protein